jgi:hypothetical protein
MEGDTMSEQRIPLVGEVWTRIYGGKGKVRAIVDDNRVVFRWDLGGYTTWTLDDFLDEFTPPAIARMNDCDARIRPFPYPSDIEIACEDDDQHPMHKGSIRDYAFPGSLTVLNWFEDDRRNFHGEWPGPCPLAAAVTVRCVLPVGHHGQCAS